MARRAVAALTALALAQAGVGCAYHSEYIAPADGRARVVWGASDKPVVELAGTSVSPFCGMELQRLTGHTGVPTTSSVLTLEVPASAVPAYERYAGGYWTPSYYGPNLNVIVVRPGVRLGHVPLLPRPPLFLPALPRPIGGGVVYSPPSVRIGGVAKGGGGGSGGGFKMPSGGGGGGGGSGKGAEVLVIIVIVIAVTTLPAIALGFSSSFPEPTYESSRVIDVVHAYNDLLRIPGSPCYPVIAEAPPMLMPMPAGGAP